MPSADRHPPARRRAIVLVVEDDTLMQGFLEQALTRLGLTPVIEASAEDALARIGTLRPDLALLDVRLGGMDGITLMGRLAAVRPECDYVVMTAHGSIETAIAAMKAGAFDFLTKPFTVEALEVVIDKALGVRQLKRENQRLRARLRRRGGDPLILGQSAVMKRLRDLTRTIARSPATALIEGESGTGKELIAQALHAWGPRARQPFIKVNCAALPEGLMESELFGHERGAFTGATNLLKGKFELADGGTLLLDEVSEMEVGLQPKLLRSIQEKEFYRVGGSSPLTVDVRILATTNADLAARVQAGRFREDLFYRLRVIPVLIPPLRDRNEDIPLLAQHFLEQAAAENGKRLDGFEPSAIARLLDHSWPGNVRELENVVHRAVVMATDERITPDLLLWNDSLSGGTDRPRGSRAARIMKTGSPKEDWDRLTLREVERVHLQRALDQEGGNKSRAARRLGVSVRTVRNKLQSYREEDAREGERAETTRAA